jgi:hypothetical protein
MQIRNPKCKDIPESSFLEETHFAEFVVTEVRAIVGREGSDIAEMAFDGIFHECGGLIVVGMSGAEGFLDDFVDEAEVFEVLSGEVEVIGGVLRAACIFPQDGSAAFG